MDLPSFGGIRRISSRLNDMLELIVCIRVCNIIVRIACAKQHIAITLNMKIYLQLLDL